MIQRILLFMKTVLLDEKVLYAVLPSGENYDGVTYCESITHSENIESLNLLFQNYSDTRILN